ncbi:NAD+ synthase [bacterium]|nr:NAD+ synthase [bacterium]
MPTDPFQNHDYSKIRQTLVQFLQDEMERIGLDRGILGLSGGLDSALVCFLAAEALGPDRVIGVAMPYSSSSPESLEHAKLVARETGVEFLVREITPMVDAYFAKQVNASSLRRGNKMARERMSVLYDLSAERKALVLGTSNKSEICLGYGTAFGDLACAINPIGDLFKSEVRHLSRLMGVPDEVIDKAPSADLWAGQSDEDELGFSYEAVDPLLGLMFDQGLTDSQCVEAGYNKSFVHRVRQLNEKSEFKRRLPVIAKLPGREASSGGSD